jgi:hypothetical protein
LNIRDAITILILWATSDVVKKWTAILVVWNVVVVFVTVTSIAKAVKITISLIAV